jgi:DNA repair protein Rad18
MHDNQIKPNKILQEIIIQLKLLLPKLAEIATNKNANNTQSKNASHSHNTSASSAQSFSNITVIPNHCAPKTFASSSQSVSKSGAIAYETFAEFSQSFSQQVLAEPEPATLPPAPKGLVSCPVCGINIPEGIINRHLDECLSGQQTRKEPVKTSKEPVKTRTESLKSNKEPVVNVFTQSTSGTQSIQTSNVPPVKKNSMKPVTKVVYNLLKDAQLRALLKKEGLDTKGDRKTMESRHKKFSVLWNAQCDEDNPLDR